MVAKLREVERPYVKHCSTVLSFMRRLLRTRYDFWFISGITAGEKALRFVFCTLTKGKVAYYLLRSDENWLSVDAAVDLLHKFNKLTRTFSVTK